MNNGHWASVFLEQEILSVSALGKGSQHHLDLVELKDRSKWVCKKFYPTNWLGKVERAGLELTESVASIVAKQLGITFAAYQYDNQTVFMVGDTKAIIIPYCEGQLLTMLTERQSFVLGSVLAQLHLLKWPSGYGEPFPPISLFDNKDFPKWLTELIRKCNENFIIKLTNGFLVIEISMLQTLFGAIQKDLTCLIGKARDLFIQRLN